MKSRRHWKRAKRSLLLAIPLLCSENVSANVSHSRELRLDCPVDDFDDSGQIDGSFEGRFDQYSRGDLSRNLIERLRSPDDSFYQDIVDSVIQTACDMETASERCVEEASPFAAKNWAGECIKAADHECPAGTCERASNCYWNSVYEGQNRTMRFDKSAYNAAKDRLIGYKADDESYIKRIGKFFVIGVAISIIFLLFWVIFFLGRYLCCCLWAVPACRGLCFICSPIPKREGYNTCRDVLIPVFFYLVALAGIAVAGSMAFVGNEDISVGITNTFLHADGLVEDLGLFLARSRIPLENIQGIVNDAALDAKSIFDGTEYVTDDALQIVDSFVGFYSLHSEGLNVSGAVQNFGDASSKFEDSVGPITDNVQSMLDALEGDLYDKVDIIKGGLSGALESLDSFSAQSAEWQDVIYDYEGTELGVRDMRRAGVMAIFLLSLFFAVLGLIGILVSKSRSRISCLSHMIKVTGFFSALLGSISLVVASIFLMISFILYDACQISGIVTSDFEPFVGDVVSPGANACFNDTNLAVAFNVTDKVDFQQKLDEGLQQIETINVTEKFGLVLDPLSDVQLMLGSISDTAISALNQVTTSGDVNAACPFSDAYTKNTILAPWDLSRPTSNTSYAIRGNKGYSTPYARIGSEDGEAYMSRIYDKTGACLAPSSCCIEITSLPTSCLSSRYAECDYGTNCNYPCDAVKTGILEGYAGVLTLYEIEVAMTADLGVTCPTDQVDYFKDTCPTGAFKDQYSNLTLVGQIKEYQDKIVLTKDDLVNLASTSVGDTMLEVEDFLCNMECNFVESRYGEVKNDICGTLFGGVAQINWALWLLGISLEAIAIISHVLAIRLRGLSEKEASLQSLDWDVDQRANIY